MRTRFALGSILTLLILFSMSVVAAQSTAPDKKQIIIRPVPAGYRSAAPVPTAKPHFSQRPLSSTALLPVRLEKDLFVKKTGRQTFEATIARDITRNGQVFLKSGTRVRGRVGDLPSNLASPYSADFRSLKLTGVLLDGQWHVLDSQEFPVEVSRRPGGKKKWIRRAIIIGGLAATATGGLSCSRRTNVERGLDIASEVLRSGLLDARTGPSSELRAGTRLDFQLQRELPLFGN